MVNSKASAGDLIRVCVNDIMRRHRLAPIVLWSANDHTSWSLTSHRTDSAGQRHAATCRVLLRCGEYDVTGTTHVNELYIHTRWAKKRGHRLMTIILSNHNRFAKLFTGRFLCKFAVTRMLNIPPHPAYVATLPCETLMSAKEDIYDKLQRSVAAYLRCVVVVKKVQLLSVWAKFLFFF